MPNGEHNVERAKAFVVSLEILAWTFLPCAFNIRFQMNLSNVFFICANIQIFSSTFSGNKLQNYPLNKEVFYLLWHWLPLSSFIAGFGEQQLGIHLIQSCHGYMNLSLILLRATCLFLFKCEMILDNCQWWHQYSSVVTSSSILSRCGLDHFPLMYYLACIYYKMSLLCFCPLSHFCEVHSSPSAQHLTTQKDSVSPADLEISIIPSFSRPSMKILNKNNSSN